MRARWLVQGLGIVVGAVVALTCLQGSAVAARHRSSSHTSQYGGHYAGASHGSFHHVANSRRYTRSWHPSWQRSALQCVPFARENSGIELSGNAGTWWNSAAGLYERGARPEVGSILNFRATGRMRLGHVAVVTNVLTPRHIEIDHANWGAPGRISRNIDVVDVSAQNDWTDVRVAMSRSEDYGSVYPTYGFIYDRPDHGVMVANNAPMAAPALRFAPANSFDFDVAANVPEEVAEAAEDDDGSAAPRYSARRHSRASHVSRGWMHAGVATHQHRSGGYPVASNYRAGPSGYRAAAYTYRVSNRGSAGARPAGHRSSRHRV